jgi:hypothetical protein
MNTNASPLLCAIDAVRPPEHYRLYVANGPWAVAYLRRGEQEYFSLLACAREPFSRWGGVWVDAACGRRSPEFETLGARLEGAGRSWSLVDAADSTLDERCIADGLRAIGALVEEGRTFCYECSLLAWLPVEDRHRWVVVGLEDTGPHLALQLRDLQGGEQTDLLLRCDAAACSKLVRRFFHARDRGTLLALPPAS